ncbi:MAG: hypothetical protein M3Y33_18535, partial [Actinomycetota bacterium]|nr:hypothetical protein [Actinomycetota bacterium]
AMTPDLAGPVIVAMTAADGEELQLLTGGTRRLYKAHAAGTARLLALVLTPAETLTIRGPLGNRAIRPPAPGGAGHDRRHHRQHLA